MNLLSAAIWIAEREEEFDPDKVTPGVAGFFAIAAVAAAVIFLGFNLVKRLRRSSYRHEVQEQIAEELAAAEAAKGDGSANDAARRDAGETGTTPNAGN